MKKLLIYLAANWLQLIGGSLMGLSIGIGHIVLSLYCMIIGFLCVGISCYYKFFYEQTN